MAGDEKPGRLDDLAFYLHLRGRLEHEDGLIVSRLAWLMASEAFFFTAYAIVMNGAGTAHHLRMMQLIPLVAVLSSALIWVGILAAIRTIYWICGLLRARVADDAALGAPPFRTPGGPMKAGLAAPVLLPLLFVAVWLYLLAAAPR